MSMSEHTKAQLRQQALAFITGAGFDIPPPEHGYNLLQLVEAFERLEALIDLKADQADLDALRDCVEQYCAWQRETIEALEAENAALRRALGHDDEPPWDQGDLRW